MKVQEYLGQGDKYFSESAGELVTIADMAPQYALNAWRKLLGEFGEVFVGTELHTSLVNRFIPTPDKIRADLQTYGKAIIFVGEGGVKGTTARARLKQCGAEHTHLNKEWMEGHAAPVEVKVKARKMTAQDEAEMVC